MELLEVGKGYISNSGKGIILRVELPSSLYVTILTCNKQEVKDILEGKKKEFKISLLGET